jgi:hypothetical protein
MQFQRNLESFQIGKKGTENEIMETMTLVTLPEERLLALEEGQKKILNLLTEKTLQTDEKWLDTEEAKKMLHVCTRTIQNYRNKGIIPCSTFGRKSYFKRSDIEEFLNRHIIGRN